MSIETKDQSALHQSRLIQLNKSAKYIEEFLAQASIEESYDNAGCPTCSKQADRPLFTKNNGEYCYCQDCKHIYLANPLIQKRLIDFYAGYPTSSLEWHQNESSFYKKIYTEGLELIDAICEDKNMLDIGCSGGYFLSIASERGYKSHGIEPNIRESAYAKEQGIDVLGATLDDLSENVRFGIITMWDVLEHIRDPIKYLKRVRSYLVPGGAIFVQVPTCDSLAARVMRSECNMFDGIEHLTLFSARSLMIAFEKAGYTLAMHQSVISEYQVIQNFLSYESNPYLSKPRQDFKPEFLSPDVIERSGQGYKIQAVFKVES